MSPQEDGAARGLEAFHKQLPLAALRGERVEWNLSDPPQRSATRKAGLLVSIFPEHDVAIVKSSRQAFGNKRALGRDH